MHFCIKQVQILHLAPNLRYEVRDTRNTDDAVSVNTLDQELQDRIALAASIVGIVSTRRELLDYSDASGAAAGPRDDAGATGGERLQQRKVDQPKERQTATAQREQLPDEVWRAMSLAERKRFRKHPN